MKCTMYGNNSLFVYSRWNLSFTGKTPFQFILHTSNVLSRKKCGCEDEAKAPTLHWHKLSFNLFTQRFLSYSSLFILFPSSLSGFREREHHHMWMIKPSETFSILSIIRELSQTPDFIIPFCMFRMFFFISQRKFVLCERTFPLLAHIIVTHNRNRNENCRHLNTCFSCFLQFSWVWKWIAKKKNFRQQTGSFIVLSFIVFMGLDLRDDDECVYGGNLQMNNFSMKRGNWESVAKVSLMTVHCASAQTRMVFVCSE